MAPAHDGQMLSGVLTVGGGVTVDLGSRFRLVVEGEALLFRPAMTVQIGAASNAANLDGFAVLASGGLLVTF
jgi:hypothetical protein